MYNGNFINKNMFYLIEDFTGIVEHTSNKKMQSL